MDGVDKNGKNVELRKVTFLEFLKLTTCGLYDPVGYR